MKYPVIFSCMSVCKRDVAVVERGVRVESLATESCIVHGIGGDGRGVEEICSILRERVANVRDSTNFAQRSSLSNGSRSRNGKDGNTHILVVSMVVAGFYSERKVGNESALVVVGLLYMLHLWQVLQSRISLVGSIHDGLA